MNFDTLICLMMIWNEMQHGPKLLLHLEGTGYSLPLTTSTSRTTFLLLLRFNAENWCTNNSEWLFLADIYFWNKKILFIYILIVSDSHFFVSDYSFETFSFIFIFIFQIYLYLFNIFLFSIMILLSVWLLIIGYFVSLFVTFSLSD